jgi:hypothetical protein
LPENRKAVDTVQTPVRHRLTSYKLTSWGGGGGGEGGGEGEGEEEEKGWRRRRRRRRRSSMSRISHYFFRFEPDAILLSIVLTSSTRGMSVCVCVR